MPPERSNFVLPANVPNIELNILVRDSLHIEAHSGYRCHRLSQFQFIEDRWGKRETEREKELYSVMGVRKGELALLTCFASRVQAEHKNSHFFVAENF